MKKINLYSLILTILFLIFSFSAASAQPPNQFQDVENPPPRPNLLQELDLSPNQIRQIRRLNQERKPLMQESQQRLREANMALDQAIYGESDNDAELQSLINNVNSAQMEVLKNRTFTERAVRRILTPEQLHRFRSLRGQFMRQNSPPNKNYNRQDNLRNLPKDLRQKRFGNRPNQRPVQ